MAYPEYRAQDYVDFKYDRLNKFLKTTDVDPDVNIDASWRKAIVNVLVPLGFTNDVSVPPWIEAPCEFYYRPLEEVLKSIFASKSESRNLIYVPYEQRVRTADGRDMGL